MPASARLAKKSARPSPKRATSFDPRIAKAFGRVIRAQREQAEIAQDAFALLAHVDRSYYGKLERGERRPSLALMLRIAGGLGVSAAALVSEVEREIGERQPSS